MQCGRTSISLGFFLFGKSEQSDDGARTAKRSRMPWEAFTVPWGTGANRVNDNRMNIRLGCRRLF